MVFFPDQALRFPDPEGGSRSAARGFAAGNAARRTALAQFQSAAQAERADAKSAREETLFNLKRDEAENKKQLEDKDILRRTLTGVANAPDSTIHQALRAGIGIAKQRNIDTSNFEGLTDPAEIRQKANEGLQILDQFDADLLSPKSFQQARELREAGKSEQTINLGTEAQNKAATFASRMVAANESITKLEQIGSSALASGAKLLPNFLTPEDLQVLDTTSRDFAGAILRKESGAAITADEINEARKIYIPQPGDKRGTLLVKRENRVRAVQNMQREGGPAARSPGDVPGVVDPTDPQQSRFDAMSEEELRAIDSDELSDDEFEQLERAFNRLFPNG